MGKQPATGQKKSKDAIAKAATSASKGVKKKWVKGKDANQLNNAVFFDQATYDRLLKEVPTMKLITIATISERLKVNGSLARLGIEHLAEKNLIKPCGEQHAAIKVYTGTKEAKSVEQTSKEAQSEKKGAKKGGKQPTKDNAVETVNA
mmetsp:Transcript_22317/g.25827  ORF Transcript_22317/g.25827 Transcript_22317/m.25827 type:complete len:148 (-) Transcript_22317:138-581(-)